MAVIENIEPKRRSLLHSTSLVSTMTLFSRVVGFIRDMMIATIFGAQAGVDAFYVAFRIPNFMRRLFAEGAFAQAFIPVLTEYQQHRNTNEVRIFIARIAGYLSAVLSLITIIGILATPFIIYVFAPGFGEGSLRTTLAVEMLRITFPYLMLISLTAMAGAILNTYGYFGVPAITPILLNISMIIAALFLTPFFAHPVVALAWGVLIAGACQLTLQVVVLYRHKLLIKPQFVWHDSGVKRVVKLMVPALFGVSIAQINLLIDSIFASFLQVGSVSWLYYTDRLTDFPLGVFGVAIATVILPNLSLHSSTEGNKHFSKSLDWALRLILLIGIPSAIGLVVFAIPLITSCFAYGAFSATDVIQTQKSLITLSAGVPAFMLAKVLASSFYAHQDLRTPVKIGALMMILNSILCLVFIKSLAHAGLTLASSIASYVNCGLLLIVLLRRKLYQPSIGWLRFFMQLFLANSILTVYLVLTSGTINSWMSLSPSIRMLSLLGYTIIAVGVYFIALYLTKINFKEFRGQIDSK